MTGEAGKAVNWTAIGTIVALIGLAVTTGFNATQVRSAADQASQTRQATEVQLFTQLNDSVGASTRDLLRHRVEIRKALGDESVELAPDTRADIVKAFNDRNYLAALINHDFIGDRRLTDIWSSVLACDFHNVLEPLGTRVIRHPEHSYGELRTLYRNDGCNKPSPFPRP